MYEEIENINFYDTTGRKLPYGKLNCRSVANAKSLLKSFTKRHQGEDRVYTHEGRNSRKEPMVAKLFIIKTMPEGEESRKRILKTMYACMEEWCRNNSGPQRGPGWKLDEAIRNYADPW
eukprot:2630705-Karenia_brevis.AAC.1